MTNLKRTLVALAAPAVLAVSLSACGGSSSSAPTDASTSDFCSTFTSISDSTNPQDAVAKLEKVGTPSGMPSDARKGYEVILDKAGAAKSAADLAKINPSDFSTDDQKSLASFAEYLTTACPDSLDSGADSTDLPTDIPS